MKNNHQYYIAEEGFDNLFNAGVLRKDNEAILNSMGFKPLRFGNTGKILVITGMLRFFKLLQFFFLINKKSLVVFHFPIHATIYKWLQVALKWRGVHTAAIIIDIDGLRDYNIQLLNKELRLLGNFKFIVAHNTAMKKFLLRHLPKADIFIINLFDYPYNGVTNKRTLSSSICIAADFLKGKYVYQLNNDDQGLAYHLYGSGYDKSKHRNNTVNIVYKGSFEPAMLPSIIEGSFGLVWDGDSVIECNEYLKYNNPHKLSLYLASGLPVIVWEQSAIATLIVQKNIGITISHLSNIKDKLKNISTTDYEVMQQNAVLIGEQIRKGFFLENMIAQINVRINER